MPRRTRPLLTALIVLPAATPAFGAIAYDFDASTVSGVVNTTTVVPVYLRFSGTDATALASASQNGLLSAGVALVRASSAPAFPATIIGVSANTTLFNDPVLTPAYLGPTPNAAGVFEFADLAAANGVSGTVVAGGDRRILLGTFTIQFATQAGTTVFTATDYESGTDQTVSFGSPPVAFDARIGVGPLSVVTVVPEPAAAAVGLLAWPLLRRRRAG